jgi:hypothetical protein
LFLNNELLVEYSTSSYTGSSFHHHEIQFANFGMRGMCMEGATMARDRVVDNDMGEQEELFPYERKYAIRRSDEDIDRLLGWAWNADVKGHYPTLSFEDGVRDALRWLFGEREDSPADD